MTPDQTRRLRAKAMLANSHAIGGRKGRLIRARRAANPSSEQDR
jgi:hypothetical protein